MARRAGSLPASHRTGGTGMRAVRIVVLATLTVSCAGGRTSGGPAGSTSPHPTAPSVRPSTTEPPPTPDPARPIDVGALPPEGVAVDLGGEVQLLDLDGRMLARLRGYRLYYDWTVPGPVVLRRHDTYFVLR